MQLKRVSALSLLTSLVLGVPGYRVGAQSLDVHKPAPLQQGSNTATSDSFVGSHFWYVMVEPGTFQIVFTQKEQSGQAALGSKLAAGMAFAGPKVEGNNFTYKEGPRQTVFNGHVAKRAEVVIEVDPPNSPLVRDASNYELTASGNVAFGSQGGSDPIIGKYSCTFNNYGWSKFLADGTLQCSNGDNGTWKCFDSDTKTYAITLGGDKLSLKLVPALGLVDQANNIRFQCITKGPQP
jgi:hypothetical protein